MPSEKTKAAGPTGDEAADFGSSGFRAAGAAGAAGGSELVCPGHPWAQAPSKLLKCADDIKDHSLPQQILFCLC
jgi:hypothetical protein